MIRGIGTDLVDIRRIARLIDDHGNRFIEKVCTVAEIGVAGGLLDRPRYCAGRWAVKEAFFKALPTSCQRLFSCKAVQVVSGEGERRPIIEVVEADVAAALARERVSGFHVSISHERDYCTAFVILEE